MCSRVRDTETEVGYEKGAKFKKEIYSRRVMGEKRPNGLPHFLFSFVYVFFFFTFLSE